MPLPLLADWLGLLPADWPFEAAEDISGIEGASELWIVSDGIKGLKKIELSNI